MKSMLERTFVFVTLSATVVCSSCGGGGSSGAANPPTVGDSDVVGVNDSADLSTPTKAAGMSGAMAALLAKIGGDPNTGKRYSDLAKLAQKSGSCDSGSQTVEDTNDPPGTIVTFDNCVQNSEDGTVTQTLLLDGTFGIFVAGTSDDHFEFDIEWGSSDATFSVDLVMAVGQDLAQDYFTAVSGTVFIRERRADNETVLAVIDLGGRVEDRLADREFDFESSGLTLNLGRDGPINEVEIAGSFGASGRVSESECGTGRIVLDTIVPLEVGTEGDGVESGTFMMSADKGSSLTSFDGDDMTVVVDGDQQVFSEDVLRAQCNLVGEVMDLLLSQAGF